MEPKMTINFTKIVGSGNDFILIDNRNNIFDAKNKILVKQLCKRITGIGADGIILIEPSTIADFKMRILNSDGSEAEMCGNGARCAVFFAYHKKIAEKNMKFETLAGIIEGEILESKNADSEYASSTTSGCVKVKMIDPHSIKTDLFLDLPDLGQVNVYSMNTGVPHAVIFTNNIRLDVQEIGSFVRYNQAFMPAGTNVNFVKIKDENEIIVRTYERGVEAETLSCGSGSTASALFSALQYGQKSPITVHTKSDEDLKIHFAISKHGQNITDVYLEGFVNTVFEGEFDLTEGKQNV
jgi:diaminopimelate epimerase